MKRSYPAFQMGRQDFLFTGMLSSFIIFPYLFPCFHSPLIIFEGNFDQTFLNGLLFLV